MTTINKDFDTKHNFVLFVPEIKYKDWTEKNGKVTLSLDTNDPVKKFLAWMVHKKS